MSVRMALGAGRGRLQPVALANPFERCGQGVFVGHGRRHPAVPAHVARDADPREQVRDLALLRGQLQGQLDSLRLDRQPGEDLVRADLEDREIPPRVILVRLRQRERKLANSLLDCRSPHLPIVTVWVPRPQGRRIALKR